MAAVAACLLLNACEQPVSTAKEPGLRPQAEVQSTTARARVNGPAHISEPRMAVTGAVASFAMGLDLMGSSHDRLDFARALRVVSSPEIAYATRLDQAVYFATYGTNVSQITQLFALLISNTQRGFEYQRALVGLATPLVRRFGHYDEALALLEQALADGPSVRMQSAIYSLQAVAYGKQGDWDRCLQTALKDVACARQTGQAETDAALTIVAVAYACQGELAQARETITQAAAAGTPGTLPYLLLQALDAREAGEPHRAFEEFLF